MNTIPRTDPGRRGSALVLALVVMAGLIGLTMTFLHVGVSSSQELTSSLDDERARFVAEAAIGESLLAMQAGGSGSVGTMDNPAYSGGGLFWVESTDLGDSRYQLQATAMVGSGRSAIQLVVSREAAPLFQATLNSRERLDLSNGVLIDSFRSDEGSYLSQVDDFTNGFDHADRNGSVRSNEGINVTGTATVMGDATPGPGYGVSISSGGYVDGSTTPAPEPFPFDPISVPTVPIGPSLTLPTLGMAILPPGDHGFATLDIGRSATLTVQGPANIVVDDFIGGKDANLLIDATNGPVTVYCRNSYTHIKGFEASPLLGSPMALAFMIEGSSDVLFPSDTKIRGAYYAPDARISFSSANEAWGAFLSRKITMNADTHFHFDEVLMDYWKADTAGGPTDVLAWYSAPVQPSNLMADRRDPLVVLDLDEGDLLPPGEAWDWGVGVDQQP